MKSSSALRGVALVLAAAMLWGTTGTAQSFSHAALSPYWVGSLRVAIAALFFLVYVPVVAGGVLLRAELAALGWPQALLAALAMAGYNLAFFAGVKLVGVAVGTAIAVGSAPIWAGLLEILRGRLPAGGWWLGTLLAVGGGVLLLLGRGASEFHLSVGGIALCLTAGFSYAAYTMLNKWLVGRSDPRVVTLAVFTVSSLLAVPAAWLVAGPLQISASGWVIVGFLGVFSTGVAYLLFSMGLRTVSAAGGVSLALMEPATAFLLAIVVVGERPLLLAYLGMVVLFAGLALVIRTEARAIPPAAVPAA